MHVPQLDFLSAHQIRGLESQSNKNRYVPNAWKPKIRKIGQACLEHPKLKIIQNGTGMSWHLISRQVMNLSGAQIKE